jgi:Common central domain of tyrosinase
MALGDGIRRNVATITQAERDRLRDAFVKLNDAATEVYSDGVTKWFKQDQIHQATHVHAFPPYRGIAFLPWHREICNRFELLLREVDPQLSLHYWDWTTDPRTTPAGGLFTTSFMGGSNGPIGAPFTNFDNSGVAAGSRDQTNNPADPPQSVTRDLAGGVPQVASDQAIVTAGDNLAEADQYPAFRAALEDAHNTAHNYIGGTIGAPHTSFRDPFVFLLHSNVDRLFAAWQTAAGKEWRLDPERAFGSEETSDTLPPPEIYDPGVVTPLDPWAGNPNNDPRVKPVRPWAAPDNEQLVRNSKHLSVLLPPRYDTSLRGAPILKAVDATAWGTNRLDIFGIGKHLGMWHKAWDGAWHPSKTDWQDLGGVFTSPPAVVSWGSNRLDIFGTGAHRGMWHKAWDGAWHPSPTDWQDLGGVFTSPPAVVSWGTNRLDIFGLGRGGGMWHKAWDGTWHPSQTDWEALGGVFTSPPAVVSWGANRLDIFGLGLEGAMYHKAWDGAWHPSPTDWENLGGHFTSPPAVVSWGPNRLDIFGLGRGGGMWHKAWDGAWHPSPTGWKDLGGVFTSPPAVSSWTTNRLDIFGIGQHLGMWHKAWDGAWHPSKTGWEDLGGQFTSPPAVVSWGPNRLDIFGLGLGRAMWHKSWDGAWHPSKTGWEELGGVFVTPPGKK